MSEDTNNPQQGKNTTTSTDWVDNTKDAAIGILSFKLKVIQFISRGWRYLVPLIIFLLLFNPYSNNDYVYWVSNHPGYNPEAMGLIAQLYSHLTTLGVIQLFAAIAGFSGIILGALSKKFFETSWKYVIYSLILGIVSILSMFAFPGLDMATHGELLNTVMSGLSWTGVLTWLLTGNGILQLLALLVFFGTMWYATDKIMKKPVIAGFMSLLIFVAVIAVFKFTNINVDDWKIALILIYVATSGVIGFMLDRLRIKRMADGSIGTNEQGSIELDDDED
jgi:hypothetical protein